MTQVDPATRATLWQPARPGGLPVGRLRVAGVAVLGVAGMVVLDAVHLTQGTSAVDATDLWSLVTGGGTEQEAAVVVASRIPRLLAGLVVGVALGAAGAGRLRSSAPGSGYHRAITSFAKPLSGWPWPWQRHARSTDRN